MAKYLFVLGRDIELALLELETYLKTREIEYKIEENEDDILILDIKDINPKKTIKELGGSVKIAILREDLDAIELYQGKSNKVFYSITNYGRPNPNTKKELKDYLKERFKEEKLRAVLKNPHRKTEEAVSPTRLSKSQILEFIIYNKKIYTTEAVTNPITIKDRDDNRPCQRPLHVISIRLAKILINLSGAKPKQTILDPFCGIGTILQEALLKNINAIGVDLSNYCIQSSKKNLEWLKKNYKFKAKYKLICGNSRILSKTLRIQVDFVVTEPYLGPFLGRKPHSHFATNIMKELKPIYRDLIKGLKEVVKDKVVIIVPRFNTVDGKEINMNFKEMVDGFKILNGPLLYQARTSKITREIWILKK